MTVLHNVGDGLAEAFFMFWETLWALVLGFTLSGAVQAFVSRAEMSRSLGDARPRTIVKSSFFGMISSSCSYASTALAKTLFLRGADFTTSLVFMIASTNLVVELAIVLWLLMGWQFALAEFVGGAIMITLLAIVAPRIFPASWLNGVRDRLAADAGDERHQHGAAVEAGPLSQRVRSRRGWQDAAGYTISDLSMLRKELVLGFVIAGLLSSLVPMHVWQSLFLTGHGWQGSLENVVLGPLLAVLSFVCSVGNVPLAAALWQGGISFGGVVSFVFADLITLPLLLIYRSYFGTAITVRILAVFWLTMSTAGLAVEGLFALVRVPEPTRPPDMVPHAITWNYTTVLDIIAVLGFAALYLLHHSRTAADASPYARDPICGMQVEIALAPASRTVDGHTDHFCSDHCAQRFDSHHARNARS